MTEKAGAFFSGFSLGRSRAVSPPANAEPRTGLSMGQHCELMAQGVAHLAAPTQDQLAFESHKKAAAAYDAGFLDDLVVPALGRVPRQQSARRYRRSRRSRS